MTVAVFVGKVCHGTFRSYTAAQRYCEEAIAKNITPRFVPIDMRVRFARTLNRVNVTYRGSRRFSDWFEPFTL